MTICIAASCDDSRSIVVGSDRMLTYGMLSLEFEHPSSKIFQLSDSCVMMTAGPGLRAIELKKYVQTKLSTLAVHPVPQIVEEVKEGYQRARRKKIEEVYLQPRGLTLAKFLEEGRSLIPDVAMVIDEQLATYDYELEVLVAGVDTDGAHIYRINNPGTAECFDGLGYHAIGSGEPHADFSFIEDSYSQAATIQEAMWAVFQAKKRAEKAPGVGGSADFAVIKHARIIQFDQAALKNLDELYTEAEKFRQECLRKLKPKLTSIPIPGEKVQ